MTLRRPGRLPLLIGALLLGALLLRLVLAMRAIDVIDRLFMPDDTYYTLSIARAIAEGNGPTADGVTLTNGFQPLIAFLMVPVFWLTDDPDTGVRMVVILLAVLDVVVAALLGRLAYRIGGWPAAAVAVALWAVSPLAVGNALNGLETTLALVLSLGLVEMWWRARETDRRRDAALAGVLAGLALLARVDTAILVALLGLSELTRGSFRRLLVVAGAAVVVVAPWWLYSLAEFGTMVPQSGAAVQELVSVHRDIGLEIPEQLAWGAGTLIGAPFTEFRALRDFLFPRPALATIVWLGIFVALMFAIVRLGALRRERGPLLALMLHGAVILAFYSLVVSALWFFDRYLAPAHAVATLLIAAAAGSAWRSARGRGRWRVPAVALMAVLAALTVVSFTQSASFVLETPAASRGAGYDGANGYREVARQIIAMAPDGAVIGSLQSGALGYYAGERGIKVVNLDGVVDQNAAVALRDSRLAAYARRRGVTHIADWPFNLGLFFARSGDPSINVGLRPVGKAKPQGADVFELIELPPPPSQ